jgi:2-polyprenyl-3-methyl-5-hydroxy-6-metoxy-1,4-benzoquinol methylase
VRESLVEYSKKEIDNPLITTGTKSMAEPTDMDPIEKIQNKVNELLGRKERENKERLKVLEAGCGSLSHLQFENAYVVGIDTSSKQLDRNEYISERIQGNIQYCDLAKSAFDVIVCWDVLEHLKYPQNTIQNFINGLKTGGILVLAAPNPLSFWGLVTKYTPNVFHLFYYKHIIGSKHAGKEDVGPFRTYMKWTMSPKEIVKLARSQGQKVVYLDIYEGILQKKLRGKYKLANWLFQLISMCCDALNKSSFIVVIQKT